MENKYNHIYSKLVEDKGDIIGHIAYSLYKEDKIEFIKRFRENYNRDPIDGDFSSFNMVTDSPGSIEKYRFIAANILQSFLENTLEESQRDLRDSINRDHMSLMREVVGPMIQKPVPLWKSYLHGVSQSILGAFLFMVILCGLIFIFKFRETTYTFSFGGDGSANLEKTKYEAVKDSTVVQVED